MRLQGKGRTTWGEAPFFAAMFLKCPPQFKASLAKNADVSRNHREKINLVKGKGGAEWVSSGCEFTEPSCKEEAKLHTEQPGSRGPRGADSPKPYRQPGPEEGASWLP